MEFFREVDLSRTAAEAIARGLYAVAKVDGMHERETGLIASFWIDAGGGDVPLSDLERAAAIAPADLAAQLHSADERALFLKTALLLTYADGKVTAEERKIVSDFARALGIDQKSVDDLEAAVKDFLLKHVAHLANSAAVTRVAKKLNV